MGEKYNDHVCIDVGKIANSLRGKFQTLHPLSENCCIYKVPPKIRISNESFYTPKTVSIGPLHHFRPELEAMEEHKLRYLQHFLRRTSVSLEDLLKFVKNKETDLRNSYAETIKIESEQFVEMILLDAVFVLEILLRYIPEFSCVDRIFTSPGMIKDIVPDLMSLENQIPMFILEGLFVFANPSMPEKFKGYSLSQFASFFFNYILCDDLSVDKTLVQLWFSKARHLVDLLILCLQPPNRDDTERQLDSEAAPSVTQLHQAGVKLKLASTDNFLDIRFENGTLEIPKLTISNMTIHLLRNLQTFEALHCSTNYMNDYSVLFNRLLRTPKDVELLIRIGVIENRILDSEEVSTLFLEFSRDARVHYNSFYYSGLVKDLTEYCKSPWHEWRAMLRQKYFNNPWATISVIAAFILLVLIFIQAVCSIIAL